MAVFLIHGWGSSYRHWRLVEQGLNEKGIATKALSLSGYDGAPAVRHQCPHEALSMIARQMSEQIPDGDHIVVGWSLGGLVAAEIASRYPRKIGSLGLIAMPPKFVNDTDEDEWHHGIEPAAFESLQQAMKKNRQTAMRIFQRALVPLSASQMEFFRDNAPRVADEVLQQGLAILSAVDLRQSLPNLIRTHAVFVVHGEADRLTPSSVLQWYRAAGASSIHALPRASHALMIDDVDTLCGIICRIAK